MQVLWLPEFAKLPASVNALVLAKSDALKSNLSKVVISPKSPAPAPPYAANADTTVSLTPLQEKQEKYLSKDPSNIEFGEV